MPTIVPNFSSVLPAGTPEAPVIDQFVREGARRMLAAALQAEAGAYIEQFAGERDENGRRLVVRNGTAETRTVPTSAGAVEVTAGQRQAHRPGHRATAAVLLGDPAAVGAQEPAGQWRAAAAVPARPVLG